MLEANTTIHPPLLRPAEMAEVLAAVVAREDDVAALVAVLAPRNAGAILEELDLLGEGRLAHDGISRALRWLLPEIHERFARIYRAARA